MGRKRIFDSEQDAEMSRRYKAGATIRALSEETGKTRPAVRNSLLRTGTPIRPRSSPRPEYEWKRCACGRRASYRTGQCVSCYSVARNALPEVRERRWEHALMVNHGMTRADYDVILAAQNGVCAVHLGPDPRGVKLAIDHDHACCPAERSCAKCRRGLLCVNCNRAVGLLGDSADNAARLLEYLTR